MSDNIQPSPHLSIKTRSLKNILWMAGVIALVGWTPILVFKPKIALYFFSGAGPSFFIAPTALALLYIIDILCILITVKYLSQRIPVLPSEVGLISLVATSPYILIQVIEYMINPHDFSWRDIGVILPSIFFVVVYIFLKKAIHKQARL